MTFKKLGRAIYQNMLHNTEEAEPYFKILGLVLVISFSGFYIFNNKIITNGYENFILRLTIILFGLCLIFYKYWPSIFIKKSPWIFHIIILFSFPFFFSYMLFKNPHSSIWQINGLVGLVLLTFFVDWISFALMVIVGSGAAYAVAIIDNPNIVLNSNLINIYFSYSAPIIYFIIFSRKRQQLLTQKNLHHLQIKELNESLEQKVQTRTKELEHALSAKTEFLNNMSHEIRTPVAGFLGISDGLVSLWDKLEDTKKFKYVQDIANAANRLSSLIGNLLDLAKFNSGKMVLDAKEIDLKLAVSEMIDECNILYMSNKKIEFEFICDATDSNLAGDRERIAQVLRNLFYNAIKFTNDNSVITARITDAQIKHERALHFSIEDQGIGVPEEELTSIFESFVMSSRTKTKAGGTGLGLSIAKEIIDAHHGKIWASNNQSQSATFHFIIPVGNLKSATTHKNHPSPSLASKETSSKQNMPKDSTKKQVTILMIDDEELVITSMELAFSASNYKFVGALGGVAGLKYLREHESEVDLILLDLMMPDMYGLNVLEKIKQNPKTSNIPVILQTGASDLSEIDKAYRLGIANNIKKPYKAKDIIAIIDKSLASR
jgi:two-component system sensor histidine kinase ChiS